MNPQDLRPLASGGDGGRVGARFARPRLGAPRQALNEALSRGPDQERHAKPVEQARVFEQREVVGERLAEAEAGIGGDARRRDAGLARRGDAVLISRADYEALEETAHLLRSPANARRLLEALTQAQRGEREEHPL